MIDAKDTKVSLQNDYKRILDDFLMNKSEQGLYLAQQYCKRLLENQVSPEELVSIHYSILERKYPDLPAHIKDSFEFLLEVMIGYGLAYREHQSLRDRQQELEMQIDVAASMQKTLLQKDIPTVPSLDIGVISVPASKMSGDYYYCVRDHQNGVGIAIADIIGKGIPAALCMSMIKYAMDSLPEQKMRPGALLENLNRVVEQNVDSSMFITMMYGSYDPTSHLFHYSGAGHEPGFYYRKKDDCFEELYAKGLVLGLSRDTTFREYQKMVEVGDFIVFLSDGVTECRIDDRFIEREEIVALIRKYIHMPAQQMVEKVYYELAHLQGFTLKDDFTLIILRREV